MLLKTLVKPKERLVTITADATLEDALKVLEDSGFRCIPILDETVISSAATSIRCTSIGTSHGAATCRFP